LKHTFLTLFIVANASYPIAQQDIHRIEKHFIATGDRPRQKENYDKPGHYEMVAYTDKSELSPGDSFTINIYFTGYGQIGMSKVFLSTGKDIFEKGESYAIGGLGRHKDSSVYWGAIRMNPTVVNTLVFPLGGIKNGNSPVWGPTTNYIDFGTDSSDISILTEFPLYRLAPYSYHLKTIDRAEPGEYTITLVYTYFNGKEWSGQQQMIGIRIQNIIERNSGWAWAIGILGVFISFVGIIPILRELSTKMVKTFFKHETN